MLMASVRNKINKLVSTPENDLTAELEIPTSFLDESDRHDQDPGADTNSRTDSIDRLQVDIDRLRAKWTGLEHEIEARKKITDDLNAEIVELNGKLKASVSELEQAKERAEQAAAEIEQFREAAKKDELRIQDLEKQRAASDEKIDSIELELQESWSRQKEDHDQIAVRDRQLETLETQLATQVSEGDGLKAEIRELRDVLHNDAEKEIERSHKLIAEQAGLLAGNDQDICELTAQISRTERYADDLRNKFQEQTEIAESAVERMQDLQSTCTTAQDKFTDLSAKWADTEQQNAALTEKVSKLDQDFAREVRQIRFELGAAKETIAGQDTINVQLTSDLYDNKGFQQALETQLRGAEEQYKKQIRQLEQETNKLRNQAEDFEYKLENKGSAIAALMSELASRSESLESIGKIENVIQEIDERMSERLDKQDKGDRESVTRLLVGESDGQEVRFPLFKNRLTIGRTATNDIQLNTQCISRRHAVIVTENGSTKIVDSGSKNGVYINEKRVIEQMLKNDDIVMIGTTEFRYEERPKR